MNQELMYWQGGFAHQLFLVIAPIRQAEGYQDDSFST
jgi:hypothetical protein